MFIIIARECHYSKAVLRNISYSTVAVWFRSNLVMAYENMTIEDFLKDRLKSYGNVVDTLHLFCDGVSPEYQAFHQKTLAKHTALIEVKYAGKTWQITRASNIRDTSGYLRYTIHLVKVDKLGTA